jgi:hypothetical protein
MRKLLLIAGVAALAIPSIASAQPGCREQQHDSRVAGTVVGAGLGALLGSAVAGHGSRGTGAVVGAVGGGVVGNVAGGASVNCDYSRTADNGYYDDNGVWHAARGYYDSDGNWVDGARPAGDYSADVAYVGGSTDLNGREAWLQRRIDNGETSGVITHYDADRDRSRLSSIRDYQIRLYDSHDGLTSYDRSTLNDRLDSLTDTVDSQTRYGD